MKEPYFKSKDDFLDYLHDHNKIKNSKNFQYFSFEKVGKKLHLGRYLLLQKEDGRLHVKYLTTQPTDKVIAYANVRKEVLSCEIRDIR